MNNSIDQYNFGLVYDYVIGKSISAGCNKLIALTGFASGSFAQQLIIENKNLSLELIIGLAKISGISSSDHRTYCRLMDEYPDRFSCAYLTNGDGIHAKMYCWYKNLTPYYGFVGSPNLSWQGMVGYREVAASVDPYKVKKDIDGIRDDTLLVNTATIENQIRIFTPSRRSSIEVAVSHGALEPEDSGQEIVLSLLAANGEIHATSGLNWGQRDGREPNQAYIPIPACIHRDYPNFFPEHGERFTITTDDGISMVCVVAQQNDKAIECPDNNSILGQYFRNRIGLPLGQFVSKEDLERYGRTNVTISKLDNETFYMDFSV